MKCFADCMQIKRSPWLRGTQGLDELDNKLGHLRWNTKESIEGGGFGQLSQVNALSGRAV
jgi:hypothetical protein